MEIASFAAGPESTKGWDTVVPGLALVTASVLVPVWPRLKDRSLKVARPLPSLV